MNPQPIPVDETYRPAAAPGFLARLARTPMTDLARGRISGRMHASRQAADAKLPAALAALIVRTVHATRLRHREQHEIAQELIALYQDALAAGEPIERLVQSFGNPREIASGLRFAGLARRSRSHRVGSRILRFVLLGVVCLLIAVLLAVVRHSTSRPTIGRDIRSDLDRSARQVASSQRAWPLYRAALMELEPFPALEAETSEQAYQESWPEISEYLKRNRSAFELARQASEKPRLGYWHGDADDAAWLARCYPQGLPDERDVPLCYASSPHIEQLSHLRRLLLADTRRAMAAGEGPVFISNFHTLLAMASHLRDGVPAVLTELRAMACYSTALQLLGTLLKERPQMLEDAQLVDLAHRIATYSGGGTLRARMDGERLLFEDLIQRIYSDDGAGDGSLTLEGYRLWRHTDDNLFLQDEMELDRWERLLEPFKSTALSVVTVRRRDVSQLAERLALRFQAERAGPLWQWEKSTVETQVQELLDSPADKVRYWPVLYVFPGLQHLALRGEVLTQQRDATLAAVGLELYRRRHGKWPESLDQITPFPLPALPIDRFTGHALCYRIVDGFPLLYSTGMDRDDDGGRPHRMGNDLAQRWEPWTKVQAPPRLVHDGLGNWVRMPPKFDWDWILWPQPVASSSDIQDFDTSSED